ncbi:MAG: SRPBCC family protein [bacterium]|nr:SRPBCC family protein [bacterium]
MRMTDNRPQATVQIFEIHTLRTRFFDNTLLLYTVMLSALLLLCHTSPLQADGPVQAKVSLRKEADLRIVHGEIDIHAPLDILWSVLTDYNRLANFMPGVQKSRLLGKDADGWLKLEQISAHRIVLFKKQIHTILRIFEHPTDRVAFSLIEGDYLTYAGAWDVHQVDDYLRLRFTLRLRPAFFAPGIFLDRMVRNTARESLEAVRHETLGRVERAREPQD